MTKSNFKQAMKDAINKYGVDLEVANKIALANYPEHFEVIAAAKIALIQEEMGIA